VSGIRSSGHLESGFAVGARARSASESGGCQWAPVNRSTAGWLVEEWLAAGGDSLCVRPYMGVVMFAHHQPANQPANQPATRTVLAAVSHR